MQLTKQLFFFLTFDQDDEKILNKSARDLAEKQTEVQLI